MRNNRFTKGDRVKRLFILLIACCLISCTSLYDIKRATFNNENETSFVYPIAFSTFLQKSDALFSYKAQQNNTIMFSGALNTAMLSAKVTQSSENRLEIQLGDVSRSFWRSDFYHVNGMPAQTTGVFTVTFEPTNTHQTRVSVKVDKLEVINGAECCGPHGRYSRYTAVAATTIEEYAILFYLGKQFGVSMHQPYRPFSG